VKSTKQCHTRRLISLVYSVKTQTNGRTNGRTDAGNRIRCILALKCDIWWQ